MSKLLIYYAHPGHQSSHANKALWQAATDISDVTKVDLYAEYPRFDIDVELEQQRLLDHEVVLIQCPLFWYSTPSLVKEWQDLVLEQGFAYGLDGDKLAHKRLMFALTAAGSEEAYCEQGYQHYPLRTFLTPLEQTASLSKMQFVPPYVLFESIKAAETSELEQHVTGYRDLIMAIRDNTFDYEGAAKIDLLNYANLPIKGQQI